jgi:ATP-binding cassette subfamily A (ABC1) protein 3
LSGITIILITEVLGIIAQSFDKDLNSGGMIAALSLLFPSCNYTYFMVYIAQWELQELPANLTESAPNNWSFKGILFFIFLIIQIIVYPILGIFVERWLYGTTSKAWQMTRRTRNNEETPSTVELDGFSKYYPPNLWRRIFHHKSATPIIAVNGLSLKAIRGQILVLLGANGSGKSTTLDAIAGMNTITSGTIKVDGTGGIGICPQKNVLWPELTVEEHIRIFNKLKSSKGYDSKDTIRGLVKTVDLDRKVNAQSRTLSGGQKRKLQLGMMLTGGSQVCCVDEVSSGLDPLSRRKIWDILLAERGSRTIIFTTHFLDEADLLADHIVILSKGTLRAEGSSVELKNKLGGGYRVHLRPGRGHREAPAIDGINTLIQFGQTTYMAATSSQAALVVKALEGHGIYDYELSGPTIEDVFLQLAEEIRHESDTAVDRIGSSTSDIPSSTALDQGHSKENIAPTVTVASMGLKANKELNLLSGRPIGFAKQGIVLFRKRLTLLRRSYLPFVAVFLIPIICAVLTARLVKDQTTPTCSPTTAPTATFQTIINQFPYNLTVGPPSKVPTTNATLYLASIFDAYPLTTLLALAGGAGGTSGSNNIPAPRLDVVDTLPNFNNYINTNHANVTPAGYYFGDETSSPTIAYRGDSRFFTAMFAQNILNSQLTNISITTQYRNFESPWIPGTVSLNI